MRETYTQYREFILSLGLNPDDAKSWNDKWVSLRDRRGERCKLTRKDYIQIAFQSGLTSPDQIGRNMDKYQLSRFKDKGDYEIGNCGFITMRQNQLERTLNGGAESQADKLRGRTRAHA